MYFSYFSIVYTSYFSSVLKLQQFSHFSTYMNIFLHFSSMLAHTKKRSKAEKKERVKQYLKELKSMVKPDGRSSTLSTLQHVLTSMRKIKGNLHSKG